MFYSTIERERACRASENPEQREERLQKRRIRDRTRHAAQAAERRGADLQQRRCRLAVETDEVRLQRMTDRLADETSEEREARLRKMTASNHEREARLQSGGVLVKHRQQQVMQAQLPLFLSKLRCLNFMHTTWLRWTR